MIGEKKENSSYIPLQIQYWGTYFSHSISSLKCSHFAGLWYLFYSLFASTSPGIPLADIFFVAHVLSLRGNIFQLDCR